MTPARGCPFTPPAYGAHPCGGEQPPLPPELSTAPFWSFRAAPLLQHPVFLLIEAAGSRRHPQLCERGLSERSSAASLSSTPPLVDASIRMTRGRPGGCQAACRRTCRRRRPFGGKLREGGTLPRWPASRLSAPTPIQGGTKAGGTLPGWPTTLVQSPTPFSRECTGGRDAQRWPTSLVQSPTSNLRGGGGGWDASEVVDVSGGVADAMMCRGGWRRAGRFRGGSRLGYRR